RADETGGAWRAAVRLRVAVAAAAGRGALPVPLHLSGGGRGAVQGGTARAGVRGGRSGAESTGVRPRAPHLPPRIPAGRTARGAPPGSGSGDGGARLRPGRSEGERPPLRRPVPGREVHHSAPLAPRAGCA